MQIHHAPNAFWTSQAKQNGDLTPESLTGLVETFDVQEPARLIFSIPKPLQLA